MITLSDIRNSSVQSGFDYVRSASAGPNGGGKTVLWKAEVNRKDVAWRGPYRRSPDEAAQDYCDFTNGQPFAALRKLPTAAHKRPKRRSVPKPVEVVDAQATLRNWQQEQAAAQQNYIYLIGVVGDRHAVKVGEGFEPVARMLSGQTWNARPLVLLGTLKAEQPRGADKRLHAKLAAHHILGEWFRPARDVLSLFGVSPESYMRKTAERKR